MMSVIGGLMIGWAIGDMILGKFTPTSGVLLFAGVVALIAGAARRAP